MREKIQAVIVAMLLSLGVIWLAPNMALATESNGEGPGICYEQVERDIFEEVTTPGSWWNWSPNRSQGPQDYTPNFPTDDRGTWQGPHSNGGPSQEKTGTFNQSNGNSGNSSWFHREESTTETVKTGTETVQVEVTCPTTTTNTTQPPVVTTEPPVVTTEPCTGICGPATVDTTTTKPPKAVYPPVTNAKPTPTTVAAVPKTTGTLPETGSSTSGIVATALGLLLAGGSALAISRRKTATN